MKGKRKITGEEATLINSFLEELSELLEAVGIVDLKYSAADKVFVWDTKGGGMVDPKMLRLVSDGIDDLYAKALEPSSFH